jgi:hypothetical protein
VLEKRSFKAIAAGIALVMLATSMTASIPAYSDHQDLDRFGIKKIYPTKDGKEWYVNMEDPRRDPRFKNLNNVHFSKNADGSWRVYADQIRMEAWSPEDDKWLNVEITAYAKIEGGSNELLQLYSRGGHHTSKDECLGSAYKARLYGDGTAAWTKEITHPAYAGNRGQVRATTEPLEDRWIGFKAVIYNIEENGKTYVRLESYIDDDVTDSDGDLDMRNNWKLASVYVDRGGWGTSNSDFDPSCGRDRDEILTRPGGTSSQNIAAFRSDDLTWSFKYLSVREIEPASSIGEEAEEIVQDTVIGYAQILSNTIAEEHIDSNMEVESIEFSARKSTSGADGEVVVAIVQDGELLAALEIEVDDISRMRYTDFTTTFDDPVKAQDFDVIIAHLGTGRVLVGDMAIQ